MVSTSTNFK